MEKGRVSQIVTNREAMVQGEVGDLRRVWEATEVGWRIAANYSDTKRTIVRVDALEDGWEEVLEELADIVEEEETKDGFEAYYDDMDHMAGIEEEEVILDTAEENENVVSIEGEEKSEDEVKGEGEEKGEHDEKGEDKEKCEDEEEEKDNVVQGDVHKAGSNLCHY